MFTWLTDLKLTLQQWVSISAAVAIGVLTVLLKIKDEELHRARVDALKAVHDRQLDKINNHIDADSVALHNAKENYEKAMANFTAITGKSYLLSESGQDGSASN